MIPAPIFVVGCPRSGTTLLRRMLDRHPQLAICGATYFHLLVYSRRKAFGDLSSLSNRQRIIAEYLASPAMKAAGLDGVDLADRLLKEASSYQALFTSILSYFAETQGKPRVGEKTALHALFLDTLCQWFPNALILHIVRDPRAVVASLEQQRWASASVVTNARQWLKFNHAARRFRERPGYLEVRYEDLVTEPALELGRVCSFLGETYSPLMLVPDQSEAPAGETALRWQTPITAARLNVWKEKLTSAQVAQIEWVIGTEIESFGYQPYAKTASRATVFAGLSHAALDFTGHALTRLPPLLRRLAAPTKLEKSEYRWGPKNLPNGKP